VRWYGRCNCSYREGFAVRLYEPRFLVIESADEREVLARTRLRQRKAGLAVVGAVAAASLALEIVARAAAGVDGRLARFLPLVTVWAVMASAALVVVAASTFLWWARVAGAAEHHPRRRSWWRPIEVGPAAHHE
jgi:hypothetical protein